MHIGGLSLEEQEKIIELLESEKIPYQLKADSFIVKKNQEVIQTGNALRGVSDYNTNYHGIDISPDNFQKITNPTMKKLEKYGISNDPPDDLFKKSLAIIKKEKITLSKIIMTIIVLVAATFVYFSVYMIVKLKFLS